MSASRADRLQEAPGCHDYESPTLHGREVWVPGNEHVGPCNLRQEDEEVVVGIIGDGIGLLRGIVHEECQRSDRIHEPVRVLDAQVSSELRAAEHIRQLVEQQRRGDELKPPSPRS